MKKARNYRSNDAGAMRNLKSAHGGGGEVEVGAGSSLLGPPEMVEGAGMVLATDPGSSNASTGAHALGPLTLPGTSHGTQQGVLRLISATLMHEATV